MDDAVTGPTVFPFPWWVALLQGIALALIGVLLLFNTGVTTVGLVLFLGWWWLLGGVFELGSLFVDRTMWGWRLFTGILNVIVGGYIIGSPLLGTVMVVGIATIMIGVNGMIIGVADIVRAFQGAGWGKGVIGAISFALGLIIAMDWTGFAATLPWVWGAFALIGGAVAIVGSFALKKVQAT